jgi:hypothetical protein
MNELKDRLNNVEAADDEKRKIINQYIDNSKQSANQLKEEISKGKGYIKTLVQKDKEIECLALKSKSLLADEQALRRLIESLKIEEQKLRDMVDDKDLIFEEKLLELESKDKSIAEYIKKLDELQNIQGKEKGSYKQDILNKESIITNLKLELEKLKTNLNRLNDEQKEQSE